MRPRLSRVTRTHAMRILGLAAIAASVALVGCGGGSAPRLDPAFTFTNPTDITNSYYPLSSYTTAVLEGTVDGAVERSERTRLDTTSVATKVFRIKGQTVPAVTVEDRDFEDGDLVEVTLNYFAQADDGTVYYLGEDVDIIEDGVIVGHEGAWLFGVDTQELGVVMPPAPKVGDTWLYENVPGVTTELNEVVAANDTVTTPLGTFNNCLQIEGTVSPDNEVEMKWYAPGVGEVEAMDEDADGSVKLIAQS